MTRHQKSSRDSPWRVFVQSTFVVVRHGNAEFSRDHCPRSRSCPPQWPYREGILNRGDPESKHIAGEKLAAELLAGELVPLGTPLCAPRSHAQSCYDGSTTPSEQECDATSQGCTSLLHEAHSNHSTAASEQSPLACGSPQPAERLPPRKVASTWMLDGSTSDRGAVLPAPVENENTNASQQGEQSAEPFIGDPTTMMIRNIPCCCSKEEVMDNIDAKGYGGTYDFFYLPQHRKSNLGYAFINFKTSTSATDFCQRMQGHRFSSRNNSLKACSISPATVQGLLNNKKHFRCTRVFKCRARGPCFFQEDEIAACDADSVIADVGSLPGLFDDSVQMATRDYENV